MDATGLRWILAIIGVVVIVGVYLFSIYQNRLRRNAAIKTYTREELDNDVIQDEQFRDELAHINTMLDQEVSAEDIGDIAINPALDAEPKSAATESADLQLPSPIFAISVDDRVAHVLKTADNRVFTGHEIREGLQHVDLHAPAQARLSVAVDDDSEFFICALTEDGSLAELDDPEFFTHGLVCFFDIQRCRQPVKCYETMLKRIDELVRILDMKVYDEDLQLLTLKHVTDTRSRLGQAQAVPAEGEE